MSSRPNISFRMTGDLVVSSSKLFTSEIKKETTPVGIVPVDSTHSQTAMSAYIGIYQKRNSKCKFGT